MPVATIIQLCLAVAIPVSIGFLISHFLLKRLAVRMAKVQERPVHSTVFHGIRLPVMVEAWLIGIYIASLVARNETAFGLNTFHWSVLETWIKAASTLTVFFVVYRILLYGVRYATTRADSGSAILIRKICAAVFAVLAGITVLNQFDIEIGPILASLGVAGLAVALALQDTLSNYFSGIIIAVDKPVRPGDYVVLDGGLEGFVESVGWRTTRIRPFRESMIIVPNSKLANSIVTNNDYPQSPIRLYLPCGVAYGSDLEQVEAVALEVAENVQKTAGGADRDFKPALLWDEFGDSTINFRVVLRVLSNSRTSETKNAFIRQLYRRFNEEAIDISVPVRKLTGEVSIRRSPVAEKKLQDA